jgi:hypothetical protein
MPNRKPGKGCAPSGQNPRRVIKHLAWKRQGSSPTWQGSHYLRRATHNRRNARGFVFIYGLGLLCNENDCAEGTLDCGSSSYRSPLHIGRMNRGRKAVAAATAVQSASRIFMRSGEPQAHGNLWCIFSSRVNYCLSAYGALPPAIALMPCGDPRWTSSTNFSAIRSIPRLHVAAYRRTLSGDK